MTRRLVIGIDFGTTQISGGFAFAMDNEKEPIIEKITAWQGHDTYYVPCKLAYVKKSRNIKLAKDTLHGWDAEHLKRVHLEEYRVLTCIKGGLYECKENLQLIGRTIWPCYESLQERTQLLQPIEDMVRWLCEYILAKKDSHLRQSHTAELNDPNLKIE